MTWHVPDKSETKVTITIDKNSNVFGEGKAGVEERIEISAYVLSGVFAFCKNSEEERAIYKEFLYKLIEHCSQNNLREISTT